MAKEPFVPDGEVRGLFCKGLSASLQLRLAPFQPPTFRAAVELADLLSDPAQSGGIGHQLARTHRKGGNNGTNRKEEPTRDAKNKLEDYEGTTATQTTRRRTKLATNDVFSTIEEDPIDLPGLINIASFGAVGTKGDDTEPVPQLGEVFPETTGRPGTRDDPEGEWAAGWEA